MRPGLRTAQDGVGFNFSNIESANKGHKNGKSDAHEQIIVFGYPLQLDILLLDFSNTYVNVDKNDCKKTL